jgi:hypothetical protein
MYRIQQPTLLAVCQTVEQTNQLREANIKREKNKESFQMLPCLEE